MIPEVTKQYQGWLSNIVFLDPQPSTMRDYSFTTDRTLSGDAANLSGVLFNLCREKATKREVLQFIQALPEQDIRRIDFIETPRSEAMVKLTETFGGRKTEYDATLLSDGPLRVLAIAAAVLSAPVGSIVVNRGNRQRGAPEPRGANSEPAFSHRGGAWPSRAHQQSQPRATRRNTG